MKTRSQLRNKIKWGLALNLSELSAASGYERGMLAKMDLPLQAGKISLFDFRRTMRKRQDYHEVERRKSKIVKLPTDASTPVNGDQTRSDADKFHGPRKSCGPPGASRLRDVSLARSSG